MGLNFLGSPSFILTLFKNKALQLQLSGPEQNLDIYIGSGCKVNIKFKSPTDILSLNIPSEFWSFRPFKSLFINVKSKIVSGTAFFSSKMYA